MPAPSPYVRSLRSPAVCPTQGLPCLPAQAEVRAERLGAAPARLRRAALLPAGGCGRGWEYGGSAAGVMELG